MIANKDLLALRSALETRDSTLIRFAEAPPEDHAILIEMVEYMSRTLMLCVDSISRGEKMNPEDPEVLDCRRRGLEIQGALILGSLMAS